MEVGVGMRKEEEERREPVAEAAAVKEEEQRAVGEAVEAEREAAGSENGATMAGNNGRGRGQRSERPGRAARGRLTHRDLELLEWLGRVKLARAEHVALRFAMARSKTYARLALLTAEGLVALERRVPGQAVYYATRAGLAVAGLPLGQARMSLATLEHDLAVAGACAGLECAGERLYGRTEREMRADLRADGECRWRVAVRDTGKGRSGYHWPDLAAYRNPAKGWVAVEVELSQKRAERTRSILAGYRSHPEGLSVVLYLTPDVRSRERIERLAAAEGLGRRGPVTFCAAALSEQPDYGALFAAIRSAYRERQEQIERSQAAAEERRRAEEDERERRAADWRARQEEIERDAAIMREERGREERRLSSRLRRGVRGF